MNQGKRILHLMMDEKFIDYFIVQSEFVAPSISEYWVLVENFNFHLKYSHSEQLHRKLWTKDSIQSLVPEIVKFETIVFHSYFFPLLDQLFKKLPNETKVVWMFWGGDGYSYTPHQRQWFLPISWMRRTTNIEVHSNYYHRLVREFRNYINSRRIASQTKRLIRRTNTCVTWVEHDFRMIQHLNSRMKWISYSYFTFEQMVFKELDDLELNLNRIWLGNSATDTNNHLDALEFLKLANWKGEILVPLSYGDMDYARHVITIGKEYFGDRFIPVTDFLALKEYQSLMNSCGIVWMNHIRQQGAGNCIAALYMGKVLVMNKDNNMYKTFKKMNVCLFDESAIVERSSYPTDSLLRNRVIIEQCFSTLESQKAIDAIYFSNE